MNEIRCNKLLYFLTLIFIPALLSAQDMPHRLPDLGFHLMYANWQPKQTPKANYLKGKVVTAEADK